MEPDDDAIEAELVNDGSETASGFFPMDVKLYSVNLAYEDGGLMGLAMCSGGKREEPDL